MSPSVSPGPRDGRGSGDFWRTPESSDFVPSLCPDTCSPGLRSSLLPSLFCRPLQFCSPWQLWESFSMINQTPSFFVQKPSHGSPSLLAPNPLRSLQLKESRVAWPLQPPARAPHSSLVTVSRPSSGPLHLPFLASWNSLPVSAPGSQRDPSDLLALETAPLCDPCPSWDVLV